MSDATDPPVEPVVVMTGVRRSFGGVVAVDQLDLVVPTGTVTVLLGPNGAGKTTALRLITGALQTETGQVRTFGLDPCGPRGGEQVRGNAGMVAAKSSLYDRLTGRDNLRYAAELYGLGRKTIEVETTIEAAATRFGIQDSLDLRVGGYSTGMKTRLALSRAILHDPDLLLLDEPTSGLDPESSQAVLHLIDELAASGKTVVMCTHLLLEAEGLADQVVMMDHGRAAIAGTPSQLVRQFWPHPEVGLDAEDRSSLDVVKTWPGVVGYERTGGPAQVLVDDLKRVPDIVARLAAAGVRLTKVAAHEPSLEELYLHVRKGPTT